MGDNDNFQLFNDDNDIDNDNNNYNHDNYHNNYKENINNSKVNNNNNNINVKASFNDKIVSQLNEIKAANYYFCYEKNYFCDININGKWEIGRIIEANNETITVVNCETNEKNINISIYDAERLSYYRKYTKKNEKRLPTERHSINNLKIIKSFVENLINLNFGQNKNFENNYNHISSFSMFHNLKGKLYLWFDNVLNTNDNNQGIDICIQIFISILKLIKNFYNYLIQNIDIVIQYKEIKGTDLEDIILLDRRFAIISFEDEAIDLYKKIQGLFPVYNDFYIQYSKDIEIIISNLYNSMNIKRICNKGIYNDQIKSFKVNKEQKIPTLPIVFFIDYFNSINGYHVFSNFICNSKLSLDSILIYIGLFKKLCSFIEQSNEELIKQFLYIKDFIKGRLLNISEDEINKNSKEIIFELCLKVSQISTFDNKMQKNICEELYLNYIFGCLRCKNLEKQVYAINIINSMIVSFDQYYKQFIDNSLKSESDKNVENFDNNSFIQSLKNFDFLDYILENNVYEETMKRSLPIIIFMYRNNFYLNNLEKKVIMNKRKKLIDCLFHKLINAEKKEIILSKTIKNLISQLSQFLNDDDRNYTFFLIKDYIIKREITIENVNFIKKFTVNYLLIIGNQNNNIKENKNESNFDESKYYGIQLIWNYMLDKYYIQYPLKNKLMTIEIIKTCLNSLQEIFVFQFVSNNLVNLILNLMIENLNSNHSEVQTLILLNYFIASNQKFMSLLEKIHNNNNTISDLIVNNLNYYCNKVFSSKEYKEKKLDDLSQIVFHGFYPHSKNIEIRVELMFYLLNKNTNIEINFESFLKLWKLLIKDKFSKNLLYKNLIYNINNMSLNFKIQLFQLIVLNNELFTIENRGSFGLFKDLMLDINYSNNFFNKINGSNSIVNTSNPNEIIGLNQLFGILINNHKREIQKEICLFLANICLNVKNPKSKETMNYWSIFTNKIIEYLNNAIKEYEKSNSTPNINESVRDNVNDSEVGIKSLLVLINIINKKVSSPGEIITDVSEITFPIENFSRDEIVQYNFSYNQNNYKLSVSYEEPLYIIRYKISNHFQIPVNTIQFQYIFNKNSIYYFDLCDDYTSFNKLILNSNKKIDAKSIISINIVTIENPIIKCPNNPKQLLNSEQLSQMLIKLLKGKNKTYNLDIWNLIKKNIEENNDLNIKIKKYINEKNVSSELKREIDNVFQFNDVSSFYVNYLLMSLLYVLNQNKDNKKFLELFVKNDIWVNKVLIFIRNYSIKIKSEAENKKIKEKNQMLQSIKFIIDILKCIINLYKEGDDLITEKLLEFINDIFNNSILYNNEGNLFKCQTKIFDMILSFISGNKRIFIKLIENIFNGKLKAQFLNILIPGIIESKNDSLKEKYKKFINILFDYDLFLPNNKDLEIQFINFLLNFLFSENTLSKLKTISEKNEDITFDPFFDIYEKMIDKTCELKIKYDFNVIANIILPEIISNQLKEGLLSGYFLILYSIIKNYSIIFNDISGEKIDFPNFIFDNILFGKCKKEPLNSNSMIIKHDSTFLHASNLLTLLIINDEQKRKEILTKLYEYHGLVFWKSSRLLDWKLSFNEIKTKFVGLKNLGNTCYMNSLFQVLFSNIKFRESILNTECKIEEKNVLYQLKYLFNSLKFINSKYFIPSDFAKNFDNEELNPREQMDIDEFFNLFIEKLENHLQNTNNADLIKYFFQGKNYDKLTFQKCKHNRKNEVAFYSIQLQIKNKKNLFDSLNSFIEGELMEDENSIYCNSCKAKIPAIKNQTFKTLPRILIFVLKRIEFDYHTMTKTKINDYYEFPLSFDMTNYTDDYLNNPQSYDSNKVNNNYKLKGFVVHSGDSNQGHYYSFICDNNTNEWYTFNDISVDKFNIDHLKKEAFGGFEYVFNKNTQKEEKVDINKSAYLLFYEKVDESNCEQFNNVKIYNNVSKSIKEVSIYNKINENIFQYNIQKIIFSVEYHRFILQFLINYLSLSFNSNNELIVLLQNFTRTKDERILPKDILRLRNIAIGSNLNNYIEGGTLKLMTKKNLNVNKQSNNNISMLFQFLLLYFFNVFVRSKEKTYLGGNVDLIKFCINKYNDCAEFLIEEFCDIKTLMEYLVNCPTIEMKKVFVGIIYCAMIKIYDTHNLKFNNNKLNNNSQNNIQGGKNNYSAIYGVNPMDSMEIDNRKNTEMNNSSIIHFFTFKNKNNSNSNTFINNKINNGDSNIKASFDLSLNNHLEAKHIPKILIKFINNIIFLIQKIMNDTDSMFLYYILYRFSHISQFTKAYLIVKIPFLNYLTYHLLPRYAVKSVPANYYIDFDLKVMDCEHNILAPMCDNEVGNTISKDKSAMYRKESYINMLLFELLYSGYSQIKIDKTYQFNKLDFVLDLFSVVKTTQDAFGLSRLINKMCIDNMDNTKNLINAFVKIIDNKDSIELDNYMIIFKRFIVDINDKDKEIQNYRIKNTLTLFFQLISKYINVYSHCDYCISFTINIFLSSSQKMFDFVDCFKNQLEKMKEWYEKYPIPPLILPISGLKMYKKEESHNQQEESNIDYKTFKEKSMEHSQKNIELIQCILNSKFII